MRLPLLLAALTGLLLATPAGAQSLGQAACVNGIADEDGNPATTANNFACNQVALLAHVPRSGFVTPGDGNITPSSTNEVWGWTDPQTGHEIALVGLTHGVGFVDITNPTAPIVLGKLMRTTGTQASSWRTMRVYNNYLFVGSEASGHGVQVFDLTRLRSVTSPPVTFTQDARYAGLSNSHTLVINEQTGFLYVAGSTGPSSAGCTGGGLHIINIQNPLQPTYAGCYSARGYTHEAQCLVYNGPDTTYTGRSLCFAYQGDSGSVAILDVTNPAGVSLIAESPYPNPGYSLQGWLTDDRRHILINDEFDEGNPGTRTIVMDVSNLDDPTHVGSYYGPLPTYAHNLYIRGEFAFLSNYTGGLHILNISSRIPATFNEVASFDTYPADNAREYEGQWHNYPFFASGNVIATDIENGLFVMRPPNGVILDTEAPPATGFVLSDPSPNPATDLARLTLQVDRAEHVHAEAFDALGRSVAVLFDGPIAAGVPATLELTTTGLQSGPYVVRVSGDTFVTSRRVTVTH